LGEQLRFQQVHLLELGYLDKIIGKPEQFFKTTFTNEKLKSFKVYIGILVKNSKIL